MLFRSIELVEGWNWISTYIDLNEVDGIAMLEEALGRDSSFLRGCRAPKNVRESADFTTVSHDAADGHDGGGNHGE